MIGGQKDKWEGVKVSSYSALFAMRCGALTHVTLKFELEYDNAPHRTANNAEYELTLTVGVMDMFPYL